MKQSNCTICDQAIEPEALFDSKKGEMCQACAATLPTSNSLTQVVIGNMIIALIPFIATFKTDSYAVVERGDTSNPISAWYGYVDLGCGILSMLIAAYLFSAYLKEKEIKWAIAGAVGLAFGLLHVVVRSGYILG